MTTVRNRLLFLTLLSCCLWHPVNSQTIEETFFENDGLRLFGEIFLPDEGNDLSGITLIQGAGESGVNNRWARQIATRFSQLGYAVLLPDKRGVGRSEGNWQTAGFDQLGGDAVASLRRLASHPRVVADKVGFLGLSQGGHVAPLAAMSVPAIPFVINFVGSLTTMEDQLLHELSNTFRQHGLDQAQGEYLQELTRLSFAYLRDPANWQTYLDKHKEISAGPLAQGASSWPDQQDDPYWVLWRKIYDVDFMYYWHELAVHRNVPSLVVHGADDEQDNVPVAASRRLAKPLLKNPNFTYRIYDNTGHGLFKTGTHEVRDDVIDETHAWIQTALDGR